MPGQVLAFSPARCRHNVAGLVRSERWSRKLLCHVPVATGQPPTGLHGTLLVPRAVSAATREQQPATARVGPPARGKPPAVGRCAGRAFPAHLHPHADTHAHASYALRVPSGPVEDQVLHVRVGEHRDERRIDLRLDRHRARVLPLTLTRTAGYCGNRASTGHGAGCRVRRGGALAAWRTHG